MAAAWKDVAWKGAIDAQSSRRRPPNVQKQTAHPGWARGLAAGVGVGAGALAIGGATWLYRDIAQACVDADRLTLTGGDRYRHVVISTMARVLWPYDVAGRQSAMEYFPATREVPIAWSDYYYKTWGAFMTAGAMFVADLAMSVLLSAVTTIVFEHVLPMAFSHGMRRLNQCETTFIVPLSKGVLHATEYSNMRDDRLLSRSFDFILDLLRMFVVGVDVIADFFLPSPSGLFDGQAWRSTWANIWWFGLRVLAIEVMRILFPVAALALVAMVRGAAIVIGLPVAVAVVVRASLRLARHVVQLEQLNHLYAFKLKQPLNSDAALVARIWEQERTTTTIQFQHPTAIRGGVIENLRVPALYLENLAIENSDQGWLADRAWWRQLGVVQLQPGHMDTYDFRGTGVFSDRQFLRHARPISNVILYYLTTAILSCDAIQHTTSTHQVADILLYNPDIQHGTGPRITWTAPQLVFPPSHLYEHQKFVAIILPMGYLKWQLMNVRAIFGLDAPLDLEEREDMLAFAGLLQSTLMTWRASAQFPSARRVAMWHKEDPDAPPHPFVRKYLIYLRVQLVQWAPILDTDRESASIAAADLILRREAPVGSPLVIDIAEYEATPPSENRMTIPRASRHHPPPAAATIDRDVLEMATRRRIAVHTMLLHFILQLGLFSGMMVAFSPVDDVPVEDTMAPLPGTPNLLAGTLVRKQKEGHEPSTLWFQHFPSPHGAYFCPEWPKAETKKKKKK